MPIASPRYYLYLWQTGYKSEVPMTPSLDLINLLERLTGLRKPIYSLVHWFIITGYNSRRARWKRCLGQGMGKGCRASTVSLSMPFSPNLHMFTNLEALQTLLWVLYGGFITQAWLMKPLAIGYWFNIQPFSSPRRSEGGTESSNTLITWLVFPPSHLINITKDTFIALITGNSKGFRGSVSKIGMKINIFFYYKSQYHSLY